MKNKKGQHQKRVKKAIKELMFNSAYPSSYNLANNSGYAYVQNGTIKVIKGTNNSGKLIRCI